MADQDPRYISITPMKNEGPFVLEWVAHNRAIGVDQMVVMTNDCTDGTDALLQRLDDTGVLTHVDNNSRRKTSPQKRAYKTFLRMEIARPQDWVIVIDADEHINVKTGDNTLRALTDAIPDAKTISMTWRLFGNAGVVRYEDRFLSDQFRQAAPERIFRPPQAWGFKTMFQRGIWDALGVHRPKRPTVETMEECHWYNGSGQLMPERYFDKSWRSARDSFGYDLVQVNHYALKSCESYLVKKMRGRAHHLGESLGLEYWNMMNQNAETNTSIDAILDRKRGYYYEMLSDPEIASLHHASCNLHRQQIEQLRDLPEMQDLMQQMTAGFAASQQA
ncbi:glycosyltransferase family 2 protein [Ruegeria sp. Ofav3-42]|uniref:glycosyltransferase family 2 protein n=1 Tax=Ruegeria sp. Ofav3-42 TaxID=2917759 RepID=UPI001EF4C03C|nr:glycosyltransferase family 2 protein [Ruegeria sp. Ofav3-42]MCG7519637.1 glycosyltransferase family 2 protein [Ruegeria sp. Ofav3-42]